MELVRERAIKDNLGRDEEAIECYDKAIEIDPEYADAWNSKELHFMI